MSFNDIFTYIQEKNNATIAQKSLEYKEEQERIKESFNKEYKEILNQKFDTVKKDAEESYKGSLLTFKIEERKKILSAKKNIIKTIENKLKESFRSILGENDYYEFIKNTVNKHAINGDIIYLAPQDQSLIAKLKSDVSVDLTFETGIFSAGIVINSKNYNLNYSLDSLLDSKAKEVEQLIWAKIHVLS